MTIEEFLDALSKYPKDRELDFGGLEFYRLKDREGCVQVEFCQTVTKDHNGKVIVINHR